MCTPACIEFVRANLSEYDIKDKSVIEVGSLNVNGSVRPFIEALCPSTYIGVDLQMGACVDQICNANDLLVSFGKEKFDILISTEVLEHVRDWRRVISNFKAVLKPNGILLITTRSKGFPYHSFPFDYWRYELNDMQAIFSDLEIESLEADPLTPGVFMKAVRPTVFTEKVILNYKLYSIIKCERTVTHSNFNIYWFHIHHRTRKVINDIRCVHDLRSFLSLILPKPLKEIIKKKFLKESAV